MRVFKITAEDFDIIPILDLSYENDPIKKPLLLQKLRHILFNVGFLYISQYRCFEGNPRLNQTNTIGSGIELEKHYPKVLCAVLGGEREIIVPQFPTFSRIQCSGVRDNSSKNRFA